MGYLGTKPADRVIDSSLIADSTITSSKIQDGAVSTIDIADNAVTNAKIAAMAASKLTGQVPRANAPSGSVIQVVQTVFTSGFSTTSNAYVDVFSVNITPTSSSNRILLLASVIRSGDHWNDGLQYTALRRGGAQIYQHRLNNYAGNAGDTNNNLYNVGLCYVDSPATTSQITYNLSIASAGNSASTRVNSNSGGTVLGESSIIAMEIAA